MKKLISLLFASVMTFALSACTSENLGTLGSSSLSSIDTGLHSSSDQPESSGPDDPSSEAAKQSSDAAGAEEPDAARRMAVRFGEYTVVFELNEGSAAASLYEQLPLTVDVEDYSTNEKIFYPPEKLDTGDSPLAKGGAGTLAYYAPWGDVVMFYGDYSENPSLYELGRVVSGGEHVEEMSGTVTVDKAE